VFQQRSFGLFSIISAYCVVIAVMSDTALAADLWRGAASAGAGGWSGRGGIENKHATDIESNNCVRASV